MASLFLSRLMSFSIDYNVIRLEIGQPTLCVRFGGRHIFQHNVRRFLFAIGVESRKRCSNSRFFPSNPDSMGIQGSKGESNFGFGALFDCWAPKFEVFWEGVS